MVFDSSYIYGANSLQNSGGKNDFLRGFHGTLSPLAPTGVKVPWSLNT